MTSLPIPIVVSLMLIMLIAMSYQQLKITASGQLFMAVLCTYALSMLLIGVRWSLDLVALMPFAAILAVLSTILLYLAFQSLGQKPALLLQRDRLHLLPLVSIIAFIFLQALWTDVLLVLFKTIYATLLIRLARNSPVSLQLTRLDWLKNTETALWIAALLLLLSAVVDIAIAADFAFNDGRFAASIVGTVNLISVLLLGWVAVQAGRGSISSNQEPPSAKEDNMPRQTFAAEDQAVLDQLNTLLVEQKLFSDTNLNLQKLARKAGHPPRAISRAINHLTGQNVSQWVNSARIAAACDLLKNRQLPVTEAMVEAGFSTKSNFNREFKRVTGMSPSDWRKQHTSCAHKPVHRR